MIWALAAASALAAPAHGAKPLAPAGEWAVHPGDTRCTLQRDFGEGDAKMTFALRPSPTGRFSEVVVLGRYEGGGGDLSSGRARMWLTPGAEPIETDYVSIGSPEDQSRRTSFHVEEAALREIAASETITVEAGQNAVSFRIAATGPALAALGSCQAELLKRWGLDPDAIAAVATPAEALGDEALWISSEDYPDAAAHAGMAGTSLVLFAIGKNGRVSNCRAVASSGHVLLDAAACEAITKRGRYRPALDKSGKRMVSWASRRVMWAAPAS